MFQCVLFTTKIDYVRRFALLILCVIMLWSCSYDSEMKRFYSTNNNFTIMLPLSFNMTESNGSHTEFRTQDNYKSGYVNIYRIRDNDTCSIRTSRWKYLFGSDSLLYKKSARHFQKKIGKHYFIFETNVKFSSNDINTIYCSLDKQQFQMDKSDRVAIGPIKFGSTYHEFLEQKKSL